MVHKVVNIYQKLSEPVTVQYVLLWASGAPNYSSYATVWIRLRFLPGSQTPVDR